MPQAIQADVGGRASRSAARALGRTGCPEKYRDRAPHTVHLPDGGDALMIEGQPLLEANFLDLRAGRAEGTWQPFGLKVADAAGTGSAEQRVKEQDEDGSTPRSCSRRWSRAPSSGATSRMTRSTRR